MERVNVREIIAYTWKCPCCRTINTHNRYMYLICDNCGKQFLKGEVIE